MSSIFLPDSLYASLCWCCSSAVGGGDISSSCSVSGDPGCTCVCAPWLGCAADGDSAGCLAAEGGAGAVGGGVTGFSSSATCASGRGSPSVPNLRRSVTTNSAFFSAITSSVCLDSNAILDFKRQVHRGGFNAVQCDRGPCCQRLAANVSQPDIFFAFSRWHTGNAGDLCQRAPFRIILAERR